MGIQSSKSLLGVHDPDHVKDDSHVTEEGGYSHMTRQEDSCVTTEEDSHMTEEGSHMTTSTAEQIIELLDQLGSTTNLHETGSGSNDVIVHCRHCAGELQAV